MSMGDMLPFVVRCVSSSVFKTTRFRVNVKSSIILPVVVVSTNIIKF